MTAATEATLTDSEILESARTFINLRHELFERGTTLAKALDKRRGVSKKSCIVEVNGEHFEVTSTFSPSPSELPIRVQPVEVLA